MGLLLLLIPNRGEGRRAHRARWDCDPAGWILGPGEFWPEGWATVPLSGPISPRATGKTPRGRKKHSCRQIRSSSRTTHPK
eukprot:802475-Alexandrium_andersonii.AAC.1